MRKIHTLKDEDEPRPNLKKSDANNGDGNPPPQPQEHYVGGSTNSGQQVIDPPPNPSAASDQNVRIRATEGRGPGSFGTAVSFFL